MSWPPPAQRAPPNEPVPANPSRQLVAQHTKRGGRLRPFHRGSLERTSTRFREAVTAIGPVGIAPYGRALPSPGRPLYVAS